jgi:hypothetical protein
MYPQAVQIQRAWLRIGQWRPDAIETGFGAVEPNMAASCDFNPAAVSEPSAQW